MDFEKQLEALNLTRDEIKRLSGALEDSKFRELLNEYAAEISNPDNKRQYEEDIKRLEEDRGMDVQFIHPEAHHVLKTSSAEKKCFINVCSSPLIAKPSCEAARDGKAGHNWTLPFSLIPGRPDKDAKGYACVIYDVVFHPDALHMAGRNERFMKIIDSTAVKGIEDSFQLKLDNSNIKRLKSKYKGVPHPAVIRKPIPGIVKKNQSACEEKLSCPYPNEITTRAEPEASTSTAPTQSSLSPDKSSLSKQPTKPHYTLKYRTVVDLQNYRNSRDSAPSRRPKDIVIIIDLPLLKSANDVDVNVTQRHLVLESQAPSYKLELLLSFPVDEDKGDAKFNKTTKQLTIILPIVPVDNTEFPQIRFHDEEEKERESDSEARLTPHEEKEKQCETQHRELNCDILTQSTSKTCELINVEVESLGLPNNGPVSDMDCFNVTSDSQFINSMKEPQTDDVSNNIKLKPTESKREPEETEITTNHQENDFHRNIIKEEVSESLIPDSLHGQEKEVVEPCYTSENENAISEQPVSDPTAVLTHEPLMLQDPSLIQQQSITSVMHVSSNKQLNLFPTNEVKNSCDGTGPMSQKTVIRRFSEEPISALNHETDITVTLNKETGVKSKETVDVVNNSKSHPAILRETDADGREVIICDHKTSAALCFQNSLWFDLD